MATKTARNKAPKRGSHVKFSQEREVASMTHDPANPNLMSDLVKADMVRALEEFGDLSGVVENVRTGLLIGGHHRTSVMPEGKVIITEAANPPEADGTVARGHIEWKGKRFIYRAVDWPDEKAKAAMLAANQFGRLGTWDMTGVEKIMAGLPASFDKALTGFAEMMKENEELEKERKEVLLDQAVQLKPAREYVVVMCADDDGAEWEQLKSKLGLKQVRRGGYKKGSTFDQIGTERVIHAKDLLVMLKE